MYSRFLNEIVKRTELYKYDIHLVLRIHLHERMEIMTFLTQWPISAIISPYKYTQHHSSEGCLYLLEKHVA